VADDHALCADQRQRLRQRSPGFGSSAHQAAIPEWPRAAAKQAGLGQGPKAAAALRPFLLGHAVEAVETELRPIRKQAGVNEQDALAQVSHRQGAQCSSQRTAWTEGSPKTRAAGNVLDLPSLEPGLDRQQGALRTLSHEAPQSALDANGPGASWRSAVIAS
jgi:hypothetical protein